MLSSNNNSSLENNWKLIVAHIKLTRRLLAALQPLSITLELMGLLPLQNILFNLNQHFEAFSWSCHFVRIGTVVLILHDCADPLLELAKLLKYAGRQQKAEIVFGCFTLVWTFTRCSSLSSDFCLNVNNALNHMVSIYHELCYV